ncbi:MAG TPA: MarR family transcriptional regulator [Gaiellales bacterium]|jgi:DNA-binding MarR family transcriptional regulator
MEPRLSYVIGRLDHVLRRRIAEVVEPHGLTVSQYTAMSVMRSRPGISNAQLARRTLITPQSMNEVVAQLEGQKLVRRTPDPGHPRAINTDLTARGEHVLTACDTDVDALEEDLLAGLHVSEVEQLQEMLVGCVRRLGAGL